MIMSDLNKQTFVVIEFSSAESIKLQDTGKEIKFNQPNIIEIAMAKVEKGIVESRQRFVAIEGYDMRNIELDDMDFNNHGIVAAHLIGAKSLKEQLSSIYYFIKDSVLIMRGQYIESEFKYLKAFAQSCGYDFNNPVINIADLIMAYNMKLNISADKWDTLSPTEIVKHFKMDCDTWTDVFINNDVAFDPSREIISNCRDDSLSWALAIAQLYVNLYEDLYLDLQQVDEKYPV